jgi:tRNA threonylcarbamoyladenosine biosynthesis protein TsaB
VSLLVLDTCFDGCSAAALSGDVDGVFSACETFQALGQGHAERLMLMIEEAMSGAAASFSDLTKIGVTVGPGTFTGTRIGIAVARGLALATGAEVVGVSSLQAVAWRALQDNADALRQSTLLVCMDARRDQVYCQLVGGDGQPRSEPQLLTIANAAEGPARIADVLVGTGANAVAGACASLGGPSGQVLEGQSFTNLAGSMLPRLPGLASADGPVRPLYLRPPDAKPQSPLLGLAASHT